MKFSTSKILNAHLIEVLCEKNYRRCSNIPAQGFEKPSRFLFSKNLNPFQLLTHVNHFFFYFANSWPLTCACCCASCSALIGSLAIQARQGCVLALFFQWLIYPFLFNCRKRFCNGLRCSRCSCGFFLRAQPLRCLHCSCYSSAAVCSRIIAHNHLNRHQTFLPVVDEYKLVCCCA